MMNNRIKGSFLVTLILSVLFLTACSSDRIENKRAPGLPWAKRYEILVDGRWIEITSQEWDACQMREQYPECRSQQPKR